MKKSGLWCASVLAIMMAIAVPVQQTASVAGEIITRDIPHQY